MHDCGDLPAEEGAVSFTKQHTDGEGLAKFRRRDEG
jgi:hypothetical protein